MESIFIYKMLSVKIIFLSKMLFVKSIFINFAKKIWVWRI